MDEKEKDKNNNKQGKIKPKQYTHIDYEALLIQAMKERCSIEKCLATNGLKIARSTVIRNIRKIKESGGDSSIIDLYEKQYVPNLQKKELPENLQQRIENLPSRPVVTKPELEDLLRKLSIMEKIVEQANGSYAEAARIISSGTTLLGNVTISHTGVEKNMKHYQEIKRELAREKKQREKEEKGEEI